jgi:hypothetical protein
MTGHPRFPNWQCRADLEYVHQAVDMISVDPTYCLMPEASGPTLLQNLKDLCRYIYTRLEKELQ